MPRVRPYPTPSAQARDENHLLELLNARPVNGAQLCQGLTLLSHFVQRCPDPQAWAANIVARPDFSIVTQRLNTHLPSLDTGYMVEALVAVRRSTNPPAAALRPQPHATEGSLRLERPPTRTRSSVT